MTTITFCDTETTDLYSDKGDRIIELALISYELETEKRLFEYVRRLNPHRAIAPKAQLIHKISQASLVGKPEFGEIEPVVTKILAKSDLLVAHNLTFDAGFLLAEYALIGKALPDVQGFCTLENGRWATSLGKFPSLNELCYACEVEYDPDKAHGAAYDTYKTAECFFFALKHGGYHIKELLNESS
ncbi:3'-5' exonuclease [Methylobacter sp.]